MPASTLRKTALALALAAVLGTLGCSESVESLVASGEAALGKGDYRTAQIQLKSALQKDLNNARARWLLGELSLTMEDGASAEKEIRRAGELGVGNDAVIPALAQALLLQGKVDEVLDLPQPPELSPRARGEVMAAQGLALLARGEKGRADELTAEAMKLAPDNRFATTARVRVLIDANKLDEAEQLLTGLQQKFPDYGLAWSLMGDVKDLRGDLPNAEEAYTGAIDKRFSNASDLLKRAFVRLRQQNLDGALADTEKLNKAFPNLQAAWYVAGAALFQKKDFPEAQEALDRSYQRDGSHLPTLVLLGLTNLELGNLGQASAHAERAMALGPHLVGARLLMATLDLRQQKFQHAEATLRPVVDAFPDFLPAKSMLVTSLLGQNKKDDAAELLEQVAAARVELPDVQAQVGLQLLRAGKAEQGLAALERAAEVAPNEGKVNVALFAGLVGQRQFEEAREIAKRFAAANPNDTTSLRMEALIEQASGNRAAAIAAWRRVLESAPGDARASLQLAGLLTQDGDSAGSRAVLDAAHAKNPDDAGLLIVLGQAAAREGQNDAAKEYWRKAVDKAPTSLLPRVLLGRQLLAERDARAALEILPSGSEIKSPLVLAARAEANIQLRELERGRADLEQLAELAPASAAVLFRLAAVYAELGQHERWQETLGEAAQLAPNEPNIALARARALAAGGRHDEATEIVRQLAVSESEPAVLETKWYLAKQRGDSAEQLRLAQAMFASRPTRDAMLQLADAQMAAGDTSAVALTLKDWLNEHRGDESTALTLVRLYGRSGRPAEAAELLRPLVAKYPENAALLNNLAWYLLEVAPAEALGFAERAYNGMPDNVAVADTYAMALAKTGGHEKALRVIERAIAQSPDSVYLKLVRVDILDQSGERARAAAEFDALTSAGLPASLVEQADGLGRRLQARP